MPLPDPSVHAMSYSPAQPSAAHRVAQNHDILHHILSYVNRNTYRAFHNSSRSFSRVARGHVHRYINLPGSLMDHLAEYARFILNPSTPHPCSTSESTMPSEGCGCGDRDWCIDKSARERCITIKLGRHTKAQCAALAPYINDLLPHLSHIVLTSAAWEAHRGLIFESDDPCPLLCQLKPKKVIFQNLDSWGWPATLFDANEDRPLEMEDAAVMLPTDRELIRIVSFMRLRYHMRSLRVTNKIRIIFNPDYNKSPFGSPCTCGCGKHVDRDGGKWGLTVMEMACFLRSVCLPRDGLRYEVVGLENVPLRLGELADFVHNTTAPGGDRLATLVMDGLQGFVSLRGVLEGKWVTLSPLNVHEQASVSFLPFADHKYKQTLRGLIDRR